LESVTLILSLRSHSLLIFIAEYLVGKLSLSKDDTDAAGKWAVTGEWGLCLVPLEDGTCSFSFHMKEASRLLSENPRQSGAHGCLREGCLSSAADGIR